MHYFEHNEKKMNYPLFLSHNLKIYKLDYDYSQECFGTCQPL